MVRVTEKYLFRKFSKSSRILPRKRGETDNEYLNRITHLYLQSQYVDEIAPIPDCASVSVVYLQDNQLQTIHNMENFPNLSHLYLQKNRISKIENLNCLKNLRKLYLGWNEISVLEGLDELETLTELHMEYQTLPDGETLYFDPRTVKNLGRTLEVFNISGNNLTTLRGLSGMAALKELIANENNIPDTDDVSQTLPTLPKLKKLKLTGNPVTTNRKYRETLTLASKSLRVLDDKDITSETRSFIENLALSKGAQPKAMRKAASDMQNGRQRAPQTFSGSKLFPLLKLQMRMPRTVSSFSATVPPHYFHQSIRAFQCGSRKIQSGLNLK